MKKYRIAIILLHRRFHFVYQLQELFGEFIDFASYSVEEGISPYINCDLALLPSHEVAEIVRPYLLPTTQMLVVRRTISQRAWELIHAIPANTTVLVVSTYWQMSIQTIASFYELGVTHLKLIPYAEENDPAAYADIEWAITANERSFVPPHIKKIVDIGTRLVDISSLFDILNKLNMLNSETIAILRRHEKDMIPLSSGFVNMFNHFQQTNSEITSLLNILEDGVLSFDASLRVKIYNQPLSRFLRLTNAALANTPLTDLFEPRLSEQIINSDSLRNELVLINGSYYLLSKTAIYKSEQLQGGLIILKPCQNISDQNQKITTTMRHKQHVAKYSFSDIKGTNQALLKTIRLAKKAAATDSDILLEGESGTGKELFVQSIHNDSDRHDKPFIAFNCAALTSFLIESELFGYEEGAFTGAKRHGKHGLFEIADKGTIFLDEISEIPLDIQVKLLRVLQEREFIRVGGTTPIPINVRVIAATNQNLYSLVEQKKFRLDLYFRLNVFNIKLPPLRKRRDDIPYLVEYFLRQRDVTADFPLRLMQFFQTYQWPGNIRELKNCLEYMINLGEGFIPEALPEHIKLQLHTQPNQPESAKTKRLLSPEMEYILQLLYDAATNNTYIGRRQLATHLTKKFGFISEQSVRTLLYHLAETELVTMSRGRAGTRLTQKGRSYIENSAAAN